MKVKRQAKLLELIESKEIETQEQLQQELQAYGFMTTQATISRDIKELHIIKELGPSGSYRYRTAAKQVDRIYSEKLNSIFKQCVLQCDYAQNIVVIKTMPGMAPAACSAMDATEVDHLVGTLAGNDTAFLLMRDTGSAAALCVDIKKQIS